MKLCPRGHIYNEKRNSECPYCPKPREESPDLHPSGGSKPELPETIPKAADNMSVTVILDEPRTEPAKAWLTADNGEKKGISFAVHGGQNSIGRGSEFDINLFFDRAVSSEGNAVIVYDPNNEQFFLSPIVGFGKNNVYCNDVILLLPTALSDNDKIQIGTTTYLFRKSGYGTQNDNTADTQGSNTDDSQSSSTDNVKSGTAGIIGNMNVPIVIYELISRTDECIVTGNIGRLFRLDDDEKKKLLSNKNKFKEFISEILSNPEEGEKDVYRIKGKEVWVKAESLSDEERASYFFTDATDFVKEKHRIVSERDRDALTGIYNRLSFERKVSQLMEKRISGVSAMLMIDLDNFKSVNDNYGHAFGDEYLKFAANCLKAFEDENVIAGRRSGDEFYMFFFNFTCKDKINKKICDVYELINSSFIKTPDGERTVAFSAGAALQTKNVSGYDELLKAADDMLYKAKNEKKGSFVGL